MITYESDNIIVGYIKNLLSTYKLPTPKIYKNDNECVDGELYIKDNEICLCNIDKNKVIKFKKLFDFNENDQRINYYNQLKYTGITYDYNTHEYLGNYLRYLRDYKNLNLMSLYNCYSNRTAENLYLDLSYTENNTTVTKIISAKKSNTQYKYIMIPVKLNQKYTIAIDCSSGYDIYCTLYDTETYGWRNSNEINPDAKRYDDEKIQKVRDYQKQLFNDTYKRVNYSSFSKPFLFDKLCEREVNTESGETTIIKLNNYDFITKNEQNLKLIIQLPLSNKSSIVVLEGDYISNNDFIFKDCFNINYNNSVINFHPELEDGEEFKANDIDLKSNLQLLKINSGVNYPFADKLVAYLTGNVINGLDEIPDNIKRVQKALYNEWYENNNTTWGKSAIGPYYGIWDDELKLHLYQMAKYKNILNTSSDILGYVDKDIESNLGGYVDIYKEE